MKKLITFKEVEIKDSIIILNWRKKKRITEFQFTDIKNSLKDQKNWIKSSKKKKIIIIGLFYLKKNQ